MAVRRYWRLTPSVTCCRASGRVILLDVDKDRYFALPAGEDERFADWLDSDPPRNSYGFGVLAASGVNVAGRAEPLPCLVEMPAPVDADPLDHPGFSLAGLAGVGFTVLKARHDVRNRNLGAVFRTRLRETRDRSPVSAAARARRIAMFRAIRPLVPVARVCLHDCLALFDWLGGGRSGTILVLGVSAMPFAAHSWLQADGRALDDHPASPSRYQPILALP